MKFPCFQKKVVAIVPAAGLGRRFKSDTGKIYQELAGKPVLIRVLKTLEDTEMIAEIIPVLRKKDTEYGVTLIREYGISKVKKIATGGKERQDSVFKGLNFIDDKDCLVLIHDGARPLVEKGLIRKAIKELLAATEPCIKWRKYGLKRNEPEGRKYDGVVVGVPVKDTIKEIDDGLIIKTLRRNSIWIVQTPQVFYYSSIFSAYDKAMKEGFYSTDDSALVERYGGRVKVIMGSYKNIKITTTEDLIFAEIFLNEDVKDQS